MLRLLFRLLMIGLVILVLILILGANFIANAGNALINAINGSAVHGLAQIIPSNSGNTSEVQVNLEGLAAKSHYDITLDQDMCGGSVIQDIGLVTTDANGNVTSTFTVPDISKLTQHSVWVDVHQGPDKSYPSAACGQVQLNSNTPSQVSLSGTTNSTGVSNTEDNTPAKKTGTTGLPNTGVAPGGSDSYDNYTFPRKY